jgi:hypothetical protein
VAPALSATVRVVAAAIGGRAALPQVMQETGN